VPFALVLRPSRWREGALRHSAWYLPRLYLGALSLGMVLLLTASSTKRELYLLPMLPPFFLLLAAEAVDWWQWRSTTILRSPTWWLQVVLVVALAVGPTIVALRYFHSTDALAMATLGVVGVLTVALVVLAYRGQEPETLPALGALALAGVVGLLVVVVHLAAPDRNMAAFLRDLDRRMTPGDPVSLVGDVDESVNGIVPFVTGRRVVNTTVEQLPVRQPLCVLVQNNEAGRTAPELPRPYERKNARTFGPERYMAFWCRGADPPAAALNDIVPPAARVSVAATAE